jgi:hypothetical protein
MSEKKLVIDQLKLTYEGIFDLNGLYRNIDAWFYEKGYDKWEHKNYEQVLPSGKDIEIELLPWKKITDYFKNIIKVRMKFTTIKDVEIEKEGVRLKLNQGKVMIIFDGYLESDYEQKWEGRPLFFFIRTIFDKYIFKGYFSQYEKWLVNDVYDLHGRIQKFLNIYRYEGKI